MNNYLYSFIISEEMDNLLYCSIINCDPGVIIFTPETSPTNEFVVLALPIRRTVALDKSIAAEDVDT